mgnify:CR=1 FL=1
MIYNYLNAVKSTHFIICILIIFLTVFLINKSNITIKGVIGLFFGILISWYYIDKIITDDNKQDNIKLIIKEIPLLKLLQNENQLINLYFTNKTLRQYDIINYNESIQHANAFIEVYNRIMNNTDLVYSQYNVLEKHFYLCIEKFKQIEYNIPNQKNIREYLNNTNNKLYDILQKYINTVNDKLEKNINIDINTKINFNHKIKAYNQFNYL